VPGASLWNELRDLVQAGFTPEQAWAAATSGNGAVLPEPKLGVIEPGAPADVLVFHDDPTRSLDALPTLEGAVANGRFYSRTTLGQAPARYRRYFNGWIYDWFQCFLLGA
jgi:imidazolonepropionase-like amidohydrolase